MRLATKGTEAIPQYCLAVSDTFDLVSRKQVFACMKAATPHRFVLTDESAAVSLDYFAANQGVNQTVLFVDFGHAKLSAYMVKFSEEQIITLFKVGDHNLDGRNLDRYLF